MNTKLLLKVKAAILAEPLKFDMSSYFRKKQESPCGTAACIAGHSIAISRKYKKLKAGLNIIFGKNIAVKALDLDWYEADVLFYLSGWPSRFRQRYIKAETPEARSKAAADRIDHFIATGGQE